MNAKNFNLGDGLNLTLWEAPDFYFGPVNINVWRKLMPQGTLKSGLENVSWDLNFNDFRNNSELLDSFLDKLSYRTGDAVTLLSERDKESLRNYHSKGANFDSLMVKISKY